FGGLTGDDNTAFTSYPEHGFTVTATAGQWKEHHGGPGLVTGLDPPPSILGVGDGTLVISRAGALFSFASFDLAPAGTGESPFSATYAIVGSSNGHTIFSFTGRDGNSTANATVLGQTRALIDTLKISFSASVGTHLVDNIRLTV